MSAHKHNSDHTATEAAERKSFEVEADLRTLVRADEIKNDKTRMKEVAAMAEEKMKAMKKIKA